MLCGFWHKAAQACVTAFVHLAFASQGCEEASSHGALVSCEVLGHTQIGSLTSCQDVSMHAGRSKGAVTLPLPVPQQLASAVASGPLNGFLQAAGIRSALLNAPSFLAHCHPFVLLFVIHFTPGKLAVASDQA